MAAFCRILLSQRALARRYLARSSNGRTQHSGCCYLGSSPSLAANMAGIISWQNIGTYVTRKYTCGYCGESISSEKGYFGVHRQTGSHNFFIYLCHFCDKPTFFNEDNTQTPGAVFGGKVKDISDKNVEELYEEARKGFSTSSYTSVVLACRKLLMHVAVAKGAPTGKNFIEYVEYLSSNNFIPPDAKDWVDHIRTKGNEANHEILIMSRDDAEDLISFSEMLLKIVYEFPANIAKKKKPVS